MNYRDVMGLSLTMDPRSYISGSKGVISATAGMGKAYLLASMNSNTLTDSLTKSGKAMSASELEAKMNTAALARYAGAAGAAGIASVYLGKKLYGTVQSAAQLQKTMLDVNIAMGNFGNNTSVKAINENMTAVKNLQRGIYDLNETAKSYFAISSAGMQGQNKLGKDLTSMGVKYAQFYQMLSRGKVSMEEAANFIPELIAKTGADLENQFANGETQMERYMDMMGKAEVLTKIKMENMRDIIDATGASWRNLGVSFSAGLAMVGQQMTAGQSARNAGQSSKSIYDKFVNDISLLGSQKVLYDKSDDMVAKISDLNRQVLKYPEAIAKAYGGTAVFQKLVNDVISGKVSAVSAQKDLEDKRKDGKVTSDAFNTIHKYFSQLSRATDSNLSGTKQQKRLLLGLSYLYGDEKKGVMDTSNIEKGREKYTGMITQVRAGTLSANAMLKELSDKLDVYRKGGTLEDLNKYMMVARMIFPESTSFTAFLNATNATQMTKVNQDVYKTDASGRRVRLGELSKEEKDKVLEGVAKGLMTVNAAGLIKLYSKGQTIFGGANALMYLEEANKDSEKLTARTFEANMKLYNNVILETKANLKSFSTLVGVGFIEPMTTMANAMKNVTGVMNDFARYMPGFASLVGNIGGAGAGVSGIVALAMGGKALSLGSKGLSTLLGMPGKHVTTELTNSRNLLDVEKMDIMSRRAEVAKFEGIRLAEKENEMLAKRGALNRKMSSVYANAAKTRKNLESGLNDDLKNRRKLVKQGSLAQEKYNSFEKRQRTAIETKVNKQIRNAGFTPRDLSLYSRDRIGYVSNKVKADLTPKELAAFDRKSAKDIARIEKNRALIDQKLFDSNAGFGQRFSVRLSELNKTMVLNNKGQQKLTNKFANFSKSVGYGMKGSANRAYGRLMGSPLAMMGTMLSVGAISWGLQGMMQNNVFGMKDALGSFEDGRQGNIPAFFNNMKNKSKKLTGGVVSWDDSLSAISNKEVYDRIKEDVKSYRTTAGDLLSYREWFADLRGMLVPNGQEIAGPYNELLASDQRAVLMSLIKKDFTASSLAPLGKLVTSQVAEMVAPTGPLMLLPKAGDNSAPLVGPVKPAYSPIVGTGTTTDKMLIDALKLRGVSESSLKILESNPVAMEQLRKDMIDISSDKRFNEMANIHKSTQEYFDKQIAISKDPWTYNLYKWFETVGNKYLYAIAAGVGAGTFAGKLFGNAGVGALVSSLLTIASLLAMDSNTREGAGGKKVIAGLAGVVGGVAGFAMSGGNPLVTALAASGAFTAADFLTSTDEGLERVEMAKAVELEKAGFTPLHNFFFRKLDLKKVPRVMPIGSATDDSKGMLIKKGDGSTVWRTTMYDSDGRKITKEFPIRASDLGSIQEIEKNRAIYQSKKNKFFGENYEEDFLFKRKMEAVVVNGEAVLNLPSGKISRDRTNQLAFAGRGYSGDYLKYKEEYNKIAKKLRVGEFFKGTFDDMIVSSVVQNAENFVDDTLGKNKELNYALNIGDDPRKAMQEQIEASDRAAQATIDLTKTLEDTKDVWYFDLAASEKDMYGRSTLFSKEKKIVTPDKEGGNYDGSPDFRSTATAEEIQIGMSKEIFGNAVRLDIFVNDKFAGNKLVNSWAAPGFKPDNLSGKDWGRAEVKIQ